MYVKHTSCKKLEISRCNSLSKEKLKNDFVYCDYCVNSYWTCLVKCHKFGLVLQTLFICPSGLMCERERYCMLYVMITSEPNDWLLNSVGWSWPLEVVWHCFFFFESSCVVPAWQPHTTITIQRFICLWIFNHIVGYSSGLKKKWGYSRRT
jgi:hypothetical protein